MVPHMLKLHYQASTYLQFNKPPFTPTSDLQYDEVITYSSIENSPMKLAIRKNCFGITDNDPYLTYVIDITSTPAPTRVGAGSTYRLRIYLGKDNIHVEQMHYGMESFCLKVANVVLHVPTKYVTQQAASYHHDCKQFPFEVTDYEYQLTDDAQAITIINKRNRHTLIMAVNSVASYKRTITCNEHYTPPSTIIPSAVERISRVSLLESASELLFTPKLRHPYRLEFMTLP